MSKFIYLALVAGGFCWIQAFANEREVQARRGPVIKTDMLPTPLLWVPLTGPIQAAANT